MPFVARSHERGLRSMLSLFLRCQVCTVRKYIERVGVFQYQIQFSVSLFANVTKCRGIPVPISPLFTNATNCCSSSIQRPSRTGTDTYVNKDKRYKRFQNQGHVQGHA